MNQRHEARLSGFTSVWVDEDDGAPWLVIHQLAGHTVRLDSTEAERLALLLEPMLLPAMEDE